MSNKLRVPVLNDVQLGRTVVEYSHDRGMVSIFPGSLRTGTTDAPLTVDRFTDDEIVIARQDGSELQLFNGYAGLDVEHSPVLAKPVGELILRPTLDLPDHWDIIPPEAMPTGDNQHLLAQFLFTLADECIQQANSNRT